MKVTKDNETGYKIRRSIMITVDNIRDDIRQLVKFEATNLVEDMIKSDMFTPEERNRKFEYLGHLTAFNSWTENELVNYWCDNASEKFFSEFPLVEDVILLEHQDTYGTITSAIWLASR